MAFSPPQELSVVLPTYNEAGHIADFIRAIEKAARDATVQKLEIIVVDDNSPDGTWKIVEDMKAQMGFLKLIRRMKDRGLTPSLSEGIAAAHYDLVVWLDCDFSQPPELIPQMLNMIGWGYDVVVNSRYVAGGDEFRTGKAGQLQLFLSKAFNWTFRFLLDPRFSDYTSGFIAIKKKVLQEFPIRGDYGEYFIDLIYRVLRSPYRVCELPYVGQPRRTGVSKTGSSVWDFLRRGRKYLWTAISLRFKALAGTL